MDPSEDKSRPDYYFIRKDPALHRAGFTEGNRFEFFTDDSKLFAAMCADMKTAIGSDDFVYLANWWIDLDVPLGDPATKPLPPTLRSVLTALSQDKSVTPANFSPDPTAEPNTRPGAQICGMFWQQKSQLDVGAVARTVSEVTSIFGGRLLAKLNSDAARSISAMGSGSYAILDDRTLAFGSHHQKLVVIRSGASLIAYCGSADFNADRIYKTGSPDAKNPPSGVGAPQSDVTVRMVGPSAVDVLELFCERWRLHPDGRKHPLRGDSFAPVTMDQPGPHRAQLTQTYGVGYPYRGQAVTGAADALLHVISRAEVYIYLEDQYLVGHEELDYELRKAMDGSYLKVIAVTTFTPISSVDQVEQRRRLFWKPLMERYGPRVKVFERLGTDRKQDGPNSYLHAKLMIVDDNVFCVGSVNFSRRSWFHDSETLITVTNGAPPLAGQPSSSIVRDLRIDRWSEHLGLPGRSSDNPLQALGDWDVLTGTARVRRWATGPAPQMGQTLDFIWNTAIDPPVRRP